MAQTSSIVPSRAVLSALAILESFDGHHLRQSLAEISRRLGIPKATALRYLKALEVRGYLVRDRAGQDYSLGLRLFCLGQRQLEAFDSLAAARPILEELASATGETAHYGVLEGNEVVYLDIAESAQRVRAYVQRGDRLPAHAVAAGKAILAHAPPETVDRMLATSLPRLTAATIVDAEELRRDLDRTRRRGFGLNVGEWQDEVTGVSAPVFGVGGVVAAIGVAGPRSRLAGGRLEETGRIVRDLANRLSAAVGGQARRDLLSPGAPIEESRRARGHAGAEA